MIILFWEGHMLELVQKIPWNVIDTMINFLELLVICIPASIAFIYYKIKSVSILVLEKTPVGSSFLIHNKTNRSIFITGTSFVPIGKCDFVNPTVVLNQTITQLKPDDYVEITVNYIKRSPSKQTFKFIVEYNIKSKKGVKVIV